MTGDGLQAKFSRPDWVEVGRDCATRGGWKARIVSIEYAIRPDLRNADYHAVHLPGHPDQSAPIRHRFDGRVVMPECPGLPPTYCGHPADLVGPWTGGGGFSQGTQ